MRALFCHSISSFLIVVSFIVAAGAARADTPPKKTLPELIALAYKRAPQVAMAEAQRDVYARQRAEARSYWAPSGDLSYVVTGAPRVQCVAPIAVYGDPKTQSVEDRTRECVNTRDPGTGETITFFSFNIAGVGMQLSLNLTQPLYTFGKIEYATRAAEHGIAAGTAGIEAARRETEVLVARAYWGLKAARASRAVVTTALEELEPWVDRIEKDLDSDKPKFNDSDLRRIKVALAQIDMVVANLERGEATALAGLRALVGEDVDIDDAEIDPVEIVEHPVEYYEDAARDSRPEITQLREGVAALHDVARWKRSEMLPDLALIGGINWRYAPTIEDAQSAFVNRANQFGFGLFLALRQPLDIVQKVMRWKKAEADADLLSTQKRAAEKGIGFEIARAYRDLAEARRRLKAAERGQRVAQGWVNAMRENMQLDAASPRDLVESARAYFELRLGWIQAIMDVNVATAVLRRAAGVDVAR